MTPDEIKAAQARCDKATEGPWELRDEINACYVDASDRTILCTGHSNFDDAEFIAHARTDLPQALAEIARLSKLVKMQERMLEPCEWPCSCC